MTQESGTASLTLPVGQRDHRRGPETAPVTLVEYGDFECPYCGKAYPILKAIRPEEVTTLLDTLAQAGQGLGPEINRQIIARGLLEEAMV